MASTLCPYLNFRGRAREAMEFYRSVFGGELTLSTFGEFGMEGVDADQIMHGQLETPSGFVLMGADVPGSMDLTEGSSVTIALSGDDTDALRGYFERLGEGGEVGTPLAAQMWGDEYGDLTDRFGTRWLANIAVSG